MADEADKYEDQEEAFWNDVCNGFIKTVYAARTEYSRRLLQADETRNEAKRVADKRLDASMYMDVPQGSEYSATAYAASAHALAVHKLELAYSNENVTAVTQFKNDVEAASTYLAQRAINIVSAGQA